MENLNIDPNSEIVSESTKTIRYNYLIEQQTNKYATTIDILTHNSNIHGYGILNILCYHVTQNSKYPFIQFMLEKIPFCNGIIQEKLILPQITISNNTNIEIDVSIAILEKIKNLLPAIGCNGSKLTSDAYKGIISDMNERIYALVDISEVDIFRIAITRNTPIWFSLPTEIVNNRSICNIPIDDGVTELFLNIPELSILQIIDSKLAYPLPDAVYSGSYLKKTEFRSVFGMAQENVYLSCGEYYYYFRLFEDAVKEGGWVRQGGHKMIDINDTNISHSPSGAKIIDNEYGRYITGGINRYALFPENYAMYNECSNTLSLTDEDINTKFGKNGCIVIQYEEDNIDTILPDILAKEYETAYPISYHMLDKSILGYKYDIDNQDKYMIL